MCCVMTSTKFAVVQWESSVGGSPRTATRRIPPRLGVWADVGPARPSHARVSPARSSSWRERPITGRIALFMPHLRFAGSA